MRKYTQWGKRIHSASKQQGQGIGLLLICIIHISEIYQIQFRICIISHYLSFNRSSARVLSTSAETFQTHSHFLLISFPTASKIPRSTSSSPSWTFSNPGKARSRSLPIQIAVSSARFPSRQRMSLYISETFRTVSFVQDSLERRLARMYAS